MRKENPTHFILQMKVVGFFNRFSILSPLRNGVVRRSAMRDPVMEPCGLALPDTIIWVFCSTVACDCFSKSCLFSSCFCFSYSLLFLNLLSSSVSTLIEVPLGPPGWAEALAAGGAEGGFCCLGGRDSFCCLPGGRASLAP